MSAEEWEEEGAPDTAKAGATRELVFSNAGEWVEEFALPHFRRNLRGSEFKWDPKWWAYEEAGTVLEALWETWEQLRWEGATGIAIFFRDYFYPLMGHLTSPDGPFWQYDPPKEENVPGVWPSDPAPDRWFRDAKAEG